MTVIVAARGYPGTPVGGGTIRAIGFKVSAAREGLYSGFVQPLGGEYAARRSLLEQLPFPCGYGVEFGLLVDTYARVGLDAMAQVDLSKRKHRNSDLHKLGQMAVEILQVAHARLDQPVPPPVELTQFVRDGAGYRLVTTDMTEHERPPIVTVDGYTRRR